MGRMGMGRRRLWLRRVMRRRTGSRGCGEGLEMGWVEGWRGRGMDM